MVLISRFFFSSIITEICSVPCFVFHSLLSFSSVFPVLFVGHGDQSDMRVISSSQITLIAKMSLSVCAHMRLTTVLWCKHLGSSNYLNPHSSNLGSINYSQIISRRSLVEPFSANQYDT